MWYNKVVEDVAVIPDMIAYYERALVECRNDVRIEGSLEVNVATLPGIVTERFCQLQEIEAILQYLNIQRRKMEKTYFQKYTENYNKALSTRDIGKYVDGEEEICEYDLLINQVALVRNAYLGIMKGLEAKNFMVGHITKLRCAGMENIQL